METFTVKDLTFTYPVKERPALNDVSLKVGYGEFIVLCGKSGCGKSTLLRNLKSVLTPHGTRKGCVEFYGRNIDSVTEREQAGRIGFVMQDPDSQIVTDKVWHELAFGLESLGYDNKTIRLRVAEAASYFGIQTWFMKKVSELSGGQKQMLNLAAVIAMQPDVLILDEPASQLDPIAAAEFFETVKKINCDLGTTVIITEHRLEDVLPMADRVIVMDKGSIIADDTPVNAGAIISSLGHDMIMSMPAPLQTYGILWQDGIGKELTCPLNVREGRNYLTELLAGRELSVTEIVTEEEKESGKDSLALEMKDVWFRYEKDSQDVIKGLSVKVAKGEFFAIVGGNGTGKSTALSLIGGMNKAYRGKIKLFGRPIGEYSRRELSAETVGILPQHVQSLFVENTVGRDLAEILDGRGLTDEEKKLRVMEAAELTDIPELLDMHPYDLSGGEQQRAAIAKILLLDPKILLLDEPTKGLDNYLKEKLSVILHGLMDRGVTIIIVSHDIEFCGKYADRCAMFFDGSITMTNSPRKFFSGNNFYTTSANRMSRHIFTNAVTPKDVAYLVEANLGGSPQDGASGPEHGAGSADQGVDSGRCGTGSGASAADKKAEADAADKAADAQLRHEEPIQTRIIGGHEKSTARAAVITACAIVFAAVTLFLSLKYQHSRGYYIVSMLLVLYAQVPFFAAFERKRPHEREVMVMAVLITLGVLGNAIFFMAPEVKPAAAIAIIAGACLGPEAGYVVGAMIPFVSNFMFGQGPWTPWQMFALGAVGLIAGIVFRGGLPEKFKAPLCVFGFIAAFLIYGLIVDIHTIFAVTPEPTIATAVMIYGAALPVNTVYGISTAVFMWFLARPMTEKIERVKFKYGLMEG